ncbi:alanine racemase [Demequina litorisediminis]|uniref:Alanine racemase n=1 Tax=Demequina litorisediminis TaxID=1849022 RepID=A0ABQ6IHS5_9MICO|nr:alanine racemase [Demequina litorisediminis]GMA36269.1 alanine racemase [Demequina litorisediminis]
MSALEITVDYDAITHNVEVLRGMAEGAAVMAVVKADAYGHGLVPAAAAARAGVRPGSALPSRARRSSLRAAGDSGRIFTWLFGTEVPARALIAADVDMSVSSPEVLGAIIAAARDLTLPARVHLAIDTGLGREGVTLPALPGLVDLALAAQAEGLVRIVGAWTHLAWADQPGHETIDVQADNFRSALMLLGERGVELEVRHIANSACTLTRPEPALRPGAPRHRDVRAPSHSRSRRARLWPAPRDGGALAGGAREGRARRPGVSYAHQYVTPYPTTLGLISAGYADGVYRAAGNRAEVEIRGRRYTIAGRVCMDQFVVDLGPATEVREGDVATLIGPDGPTATHWAEAADTINYEVVCRFGGLRPKESA